MPSVTGTDTGGGTGSYDVGDNYTQFGFSYTNRVNESFSYALIVDQPYGANTTYSGDPGSANLAGTMADLSSQAATLVLRYQFGERFSVFGGLSYEGVEADVALNGLAYAAGISAAATAAPGFPPVPTTPGDFLANGGYTFAMDRDYSVGYLVGAAYEIPDIALRVALTYRFETEHSADTVESMFGLTVPGTVNYVTPQSVNLDFQTGIAEGTLLTAGFRWTEFSAVDLIPTFLGTDLVDLDDSFRYSLGIARRFNDSFAGSLTLTYEPEGDGATVSPLGPTDGQFGITLGGRYTDGNMSISGGLNYTWLGDAFAGVGGVPVAAFSGNTAVGFGLRAEFTF